MTDARDIDTDLPGVWTLCATGGCHADALQAVVHAWSVIAILDLFLVQFGDAGWPRSYWVERACLAAGIWAVWHACRAKSAFLSMILMENMAVCEDVELCGKIQTYVCAKRYLAEPDRGQYLETNTHGHMLCNSVDDILHLEAYEDGKAPTSYRT